MRPPIAFAALSLVALGGCPGATPPPQYPIQDPAQILAGFRARETAFHSVRARGSAEHFGQQGRVRGNVTLFVQLPDHMRVDTFAFGHLASSMVSDGTHFALLQGDQFLEGPASACVAAQLLGIAMEPRDVASVLAGGAPLLSDRLGRPRWENGVYVVDVEGSNGTSERIELELPEAEHGVAASAQHPRLHHVVIRDREGTRAEISYQNYRDVNGVAFPDRVRVVMPREHTDTQLRFDEVVPNYVVPPNPDTPGVPPPDPFQLPPPAGAHVQRIDCGSASSSAPPSGSPQP